MKYLTGSSYFFSGYSGFVPRDFDYIEIVDNPDILDVELIFDENKNVVHQYRRRPKLDIILDVIKVKGNTHVCSFLIPEFAKELGITIEDLPLIEKTIDEFPPKYRYYKIIYNSYIKNNSFTLTDEQRLAAYNCYNEYRQQYEQRRALRKMKRAG